VLPYCCRAWLTGRPLMDDNCGSHIWLIWRLPTDDDSTLSTRLLIWQIQELGDRQKGHSCCRLMLPRVEEFRA